jgi:hypothetical protein
MSSRGEARRNRRSKWLRKELEAQFLSGIMLVASADSPGRPGIRLTISLVRTSNGTARVNVEHYFSGDWDRTLEQNRQEFSNFDEALLWLQKNCGVHWTQLHEPREPAST